MSEFQPMDTAPKDRPIEVLVHHANRKYAADKRHEWEQVVVATWTDFNGGGWTWNGLCGEFQGWREVAK